ncbi:MAG TPA: GNAT family N-acetyltransferase [Acidimicrobiales bacterium]|nr:GNAT family N-acetyltransferase [Acidimicrobiales bacterium]
MTEDAARDAARVAGVDVRLVDDTGELEELEALFGELWREPGGAVPVTSHLMAALRLSGNYVAGAWRAGELAGGSVAWSGPPEARELHSHLTAVVPGHQGTGVGTALKAHQRAWAAERGYHAITWTFDPLVRRNAAFNLRTLSARVERYLPNAYGPMHDALNAAGGESDRLLVRCEIAPASPPATTGTGRRILVATPEDIESLRRGSPSEAQSWRSRLRESLGGALAAGGRVTGFTEAGEYVVEVPCP